jgi:hypothetical protein
MEDIKRKIRGLLDKAENAGTPEEAETFLAGAQRLMAKYELDMAAIRAYNKVQGDEIVSELIAITNPYAEAKGQVLRSVAESQKLRVVWSNAKHIKTASGTVKGRALFIFGPKSKLDWTKELWTSVQVHMTSEMLGSQPDMTGWYGGNIKGWRNSFILGYSQGIGRVLSQALQEGEKEARQDMSPDVSSSVDLVLLDEKTRIDDAVSQKFPTLVSRTSSNVSNHSGYSTGRVSGATFSGHRQSVSGSRGSLGSGT